MSAVHGNAQDDDQTKVVGAPVSGVRSGAPAGDPDATLIDPEQTVIKPQTRPQIRPQPVAQAPQAFAAQAPIPAAPRQSAHQPRPPLHPKTGTALALPPGFRLHEYRIDRVLGQGGFGITYLATDVNLNTRVAIKEYLPESIAFRKTGQTVSAHSSRFQDRYKSGLDSFLVEARTLATFRHPNIVRVARFFEAHQTAYMVLEYERGSPLKDWWPKHAHMGEKELALLLQPLLDGLSVMHEAGFLHRDIKPDNIQVRRGSGSLVLLDFGAARQAVSAGAEAEVALTPGYAPIEQYGYDDCGEQGPWTDIYALGATLYWMIGGKKPPDAEAREHDPDPLPPAAEVGRGRYSAEFLGAIDWALQRRAQDRPKSIREWERALFAAQAASLGLQQALQASDGPIHIEMSAWTLLKSPRLIWGRVTRVLRDVVEPSSWPLALKMTLAMIMTALMPMIITAYYNLQVNLQAVSAGELRGLEQLARSTAGRLAQLIGDSQNLARSLGNDVDFVAFLRRPDEAGRAAMTAKVEALVRSNPDIYLIMVMDRAGNAIVSNDPQITGRNFAFREYFKSAMQGRPYVTGIVVGSVSLTAGMFYAYPVFDAERHIVGAVVLRIRASSFESILKEVNQGSQLTPFLVDGDGVVVFHPDRRALYASLAPLPAARLAEIRADQRFRRDTIASLDMPDLARAMVGARDLGHVSYHSTLTNAEEIAGFAPVRGHDMVVGVSESRARFEAPLNDLFLHVLGSVLLVGLLFLGLALMFARSIVRPIRALTLAAHALKSGDYARATVAVKSRDEIGRLARTFNVLIDVLRQRERERQASSSSRRADDA